MRAGAARCDSLETDTLGGPVWLAVNRVSHAGRDAARLPIARRRTTDRGGSLCCWWRRPTIGATCRARSRSIPHCSKRIPSRMDSTWSTVLDGLEMSETAPCAQAARLSVLGNDAGPMTVKRLYERGNPVVRGSESVTLLVPLQKVPDGFSPHPLPHALGRARAAQAFKLMLRCRSNTHMIIAAHRAIATTAS